MPSTYFWKRNVEILIDEREWTFPKQNITFTVNFDSDTIPDTTDISIFNLSDDSINNIVSGLGIVMNAGYNSDMGTILEGVIKSASLERNGVDRELKLSCINVSNDYLNANITYMYGAGSTSEHMIRDVLGTVGIIPSVVNLASPQAYWSGFYANGPVINVIRRLADDADSKVINRNGDIMIVPDYGGDEDVIWTLDAAHGLMDIKPIDEDGNPAKYQVKMLLNHAIQPYALLNIDSDTFQGKAVVMEGTHTSGGFGGDFTTECKVIPL